MTEMINRVDQLMSRPVRIDSAKARALIPNEKGLYWIEFAITPEKVSKVVRRSEDVIKGHGNVPRIAADSLSQLGKLVIKPRGRGTYVVYNGINLDLRKRAWEHWEGGTGTGCLCLSNYKGIAGANVKMRVVLESQLSEEFQITYRKPFINAIEQAWRAKHGWPLLCKA